MSAADEADQVLAWAEESPTERAAQAVKKIKALKVGDTDPDVDHVRDVGAVLATMASAAEFLKA